MRVRITKICGDESICDAIFARHTWASWHVQNGTSLQELQQLGGGASFEHGASLCTFK